ncbi:MAG: cyclic nucleotide-binding domain-containing protein [Myxococcota bacterium]
MLGDLMADSHLFDLLDSEGRNRLDQIAEVRTFQAGATVMEEGEVGDAFYLLLDGEADVEASDFTETPRDVARLTPGHVFGEIAALTGEPRTATVVAKTSLKVHRFEASAVFKILDDYPDVVEALKRLGIARSEELMARLQEDEP